MEVSIIIPVYNVAPYIEDCLKSVMRQTYTGPMECLIVDDCGADESIPIAERMIAEYAGPIRFEILHHDHNRGLSAARNTGMAKAEGDYIFFIDSDDEITEDCLEKMMAVALADQAVELVQGRYIRHQDGKQELWPKEIQETRACTNAEVRDCFYQHRQVTVAAWNKLMKRSILQENNLSFIEGLLYEDTPWTFYWLKCFKNASFLADVTYHYKIRPKSIVTGTVKETAEIHRLKGYHNMVAHLTPGYEEQEIEYYIPFFVGLFLRHLYHMPELKEDLKVIWRYTWRQRKWKLCVVLAICYIFRRFKWAGRCLYSFLLRLRHPSQIPKDFARLWRWIKRQNRFKPVLWWTTSNTCPSKV